MQLFLLSTHFGKSGNRLLMCSKRLKDNARTHTYTQTYTHKMRNIKPLIVPVHIKAWLTKQAGLVDKQENKKMALMTSVHKDSDCIVCLITRLKERWSWDESTSFNEIDWWGFLQQWSALVFVCISNSTRCTIWTIKSIFALCCHKHFYKPTLKPFYNTVTCDTKK